MPKVSDEQREAMYLRANRYATECGWDTVPQIMTDFAVAESAAAYEAGQRAASKWTPVGDGLPEGVPRVLVSWQNVVETACCINGVWYDENDNVMTFGQPEAWMPLPEPYIDTLRNPE